MKMDYASPFSHRHQYAKLPRIFLEFAEVMKATPQSHTGTEGEKSLRRTYEKCRNGHEQLNVIKVTYK